MSAVIPRNASRALVQFISNQPGAPVLKVNFKFPKDTEAMQAILDAWHMGPSRTTSRITFEEVVQKADYTVTPIVPKITRQFSIDLNTVLFIETQYYNDEPNQTSP